MRPLGCLTLGGDGVTIAIRWGVSRKKSDIPGILFQMLHLLPSLSES
jgi:hypothetical protein